MSHAAPRLQHTLELLGPEAMGRADRWTIEAGVPGLTLMRNAGAAVAGRVRDLWDGGAVVVLCGPGNNGGDGFVAAQLLAEWGFPVRLRLCGDRDALGGDAAAAAAAWTGAVEPLGTPDLDGVGVVVDALFGAGLARALSAAAATWAQASDAADVTVLAVDLPSGVDGASGAVAGVSFTAAETVTFGRAKPGHLLLPGAERCGRLVIADIGLDEVAVMRAHAATTPRLWRNLPALWAAAAAPRRPGDHKYKRGHATVVAGGTETGGAGRLAARAALAAGAGLVTLACPRPALATHAARLEAVMVRAFDDDLGALLADERRRAWLLGPGGGVDAGLRAQVEAVLATGRPTVLDADALTVFAGDTQGLARLVRGPVVLTPHEGEAQRLLAIADGKLAHARQLAEATGAVVVHKGFDSVIATPDGRTAISGNGCPALATAGAGDVLAGLVLAHLAQGRPPFEAAAAAVWLHNEAAWVDPACLTADRLAGQLSPAIIHSPAVDA